MTCYGENGKKALNKKKKREKSLESFKAFRKEYLNMKIHFIDARG
jgi:hypothetical protein